MSWLLKIGFGLVVVAAILMGLVWMQVLQPQQIGFAAVFLILASAAYAITVARAAVVARRRLERTGKYIGRLRVPAILIVLIVVSAVFMIATYRMAFPYYFDASPSVRPNGEVVWTDLSGRVVRPGIMSDVMRSERVSELSALSFLLLWNSCFAAVASRAVALDRLGRSDAM